MTGAGHRLDGRLAGMRCRARRWAQARMQALEVKELGKGRLTDSRCRLAAVAHYRQGAGHRLEGWLAGMRCRARRWA